MTNRKTDVDEETAVCCGIEQDRQQEVIIPSIVEDEKCLPTYSSDLAAGADVRAFIKEDMLLKPGDSVLVPTGLRLAIPEGYEIQVRPRSGLALKNQITVLNTPGTIDADYRGEIGVILINHGKQIFTITPGMRIAQIVLSLVCRATFLKEDSLTKTSRGEGGFGHTGTN
ncbi:MAG TPA: dUTP diphosphatase [Rhabdochlamydiaceae bacterium]|nr:dUTP diphosphatase [Rhabdochlamydiaceae bacterium]